MRGGILLLGLAAVVAGYLITLSDVSWLTYTGYIVGAFGIIAALVGLFGKKY